MLTNKADKSEDSSGQNLVDFVFDIKQVPEEHRKDIRIEEWLKFEGDYVEANETILILGIDIMNNAKISSRISGFLEIYNNSGWRTRANDGDKLFSIHKNVDKDKANDLLVLKNHRFENIPNIVFNDFTNTKTIKWKQVGGSAKHPKDFVAPDSIVFEGDKSENIMIFTLENIERKDYIVFKFPTKYYRLSKGDYVSLLFENKQIIKFNIVNDSYKFSDFAIGGHLFETKVQLTTKQLSVLKEFEILKWQISLHKNEKIIGGDSNPVNRFCAKKLAQEYHNIVINEIENYEPIENIIEILEQEEICYVYLMIDTINKYHKIGISNNPTYREKTLQSEKPTIEMLCAKKFPSRKLAVSFEQALHNTYDKFRIRGEWFELSVKDLNELKSVLSS